MWDNNRTNLAIVDDHPIVLEGLQNLLSGANHIHIAGCFTTGNDFIDHLKKHKIDIVLLDITLPDVSGIELCREIKRIAPNISVLALSNHSERSIIMQMLQNGASGYLLKNIAADELIQCINESLLGHITFSQAVKVIMARPTSSDLKGIPQLTKREKEILHLIAEGKTTAIIAAELFLSPLTIETHRKNLLQKFEVKNVAALIKEAVKHQLI